MLPNPAWPLPLTLAEFKAWLSRCVIIIPGPHVSVYKKWRTKSYQCSHNIRHARCHARAHYALVSTKNGVLKVISVAFSSVFAYQVKEATEFLLNLLEDYLLQPFFCLLVSRTLVRRPPHLPDLLLRPCDSSSNMVRLTGYSAVECCPCTDMLTCLTAYNVSGAGTIV